MIESYRKKVTAVGFCSSEVKLGKLDRKLSSNFL